MSSAAPPTNAATNSASSASVATTHCPTTNNPAAARRRSSFVPATQVSSQLLAGLAAQDFYRRTLLHNNNHNNNSSGFAVTHQGQTASRFHGSLIPTTTTAFAPTTSVQVIAAAPAPPTTTMTTVATASPSARSASLSASSSKLAALTEAAAAGLPLPLPPLQNNLQNNHQGQKNKGHNNNASSSLPSSSGIQFLLDAANQLKPLAHQYHHHAPMDHHNHALAHGVDDDKDDDDDDDEPAVVLVPKPTKKKRKAHNNKGTTTMSKLVKRSKVETHTKTTLLNDFTETTSRRPTPARSVTEDHVLTEGPPDKNSDTNGAATDDDALANQKYFATKDVVENTIGSFFWVGRGGYGITHPGNMQVRSVIQQKAIEYASLRRNQRGHVALDVLQHELRHVKFVAPRETLLAQLDADDEKERLGQVFVRKLSKKRRECLVQVHGSLEELRSYPDDVCVLVGESWVLDIINHQLREEAEALRKKGPTTAASGDEDKAPEAEAIQKTKSSKKRASSTASTTGGNNSSSSKKRKTMELPPKPTLPAAPAAATAAGLLLF